MTAKEYLQQVKQKEARIKNLQRDKEDIGTMLYSFGGNIEGERVQSSRNFDKFGTLYGRIDEINRKIDVQIGELFEFRMKVSEQINELRNERDMMVLHRRYIRFQSWEQISSDTGLSVRQILRIHGRALREFQKKYGEILAD